MVRPNVWISGLAAFLSFTAAHGGQTENILDGLIRVEREFARMSMEKGIRQAFLQYLAPDAVVFQPKPIPGRPVYEALEPGSPATLNWRPEFAEVSRAGDLGYTTGPYEFRKSSNDVASARFGHYVSVWEMQAEGGWKVRCDIGVSHDEPPAGGDEVKSPVREGSGPRLLTPRKQAAEKETLFSLERNGAFPMARNGLEASSVLMTTEDVRLYREGSLPRSGIAALRELLSAGMAPLAWEPRGGGVAASGDLAYTYGAGTLKGNDKPGVTTASYLRIWRKSAEGGAWKVALEVILGAAEK